MGTNATKPTSAAYHRVVTPPPTVCVVPAPAAPHAPRRRGRGVPPVLALALACAAIAPPDAAATPCTARYAVTPRLDTVPRRLDVVVTFDAGGRPTTRLTLPAGWGGVDDFGRRLQGWTAAGAATAVTADAGGAAWTVAHATAGTVRVGWQVASALAEPDDPRQPQDQSHLYRVQVGADWWQFFGHALLPGLDSHGDDRPGRWCVDIVRPDGAPADAFGSHVDGPVAGSTVVDGSHALLRHGFWGGGPGWRRASGDVAGGPVGVAVRGRYAADDASLVGQIVALVGTHRRFWGDAQSPPQWVVVTPNHARNDVGGTLVHRAAVMHASPDFGPRHPAFDFLVGHEHLHQWIPGRFGAMAPRGGSFIPQAWFSEGFTDYYTHRLLLASGHWTLQRYADELTERLRRHRRSPHRDSGSAALAPRFFADRDAGDQFYRRGEMLAMRWDRALRARGHPGLDAVMRALLLPASVEAGTEARLATQRLLDALQPLLGGAPADEVARHVDQGQALPLEPDLAGPCFAIGEGDVPVWTLGFDAAASVGDRRARGVQPTGPAYAAGLRDGMALAGWSWRRGDTDSEVEVRVAADDGSGERTLRWRPVDGRMQRLPQVSVRDGAADAPTCRDWLHRGRDTR